MILWILSQKLPSINILLCRNRPNHGVQIIENADSDITNHDDEDLMLFQNIDSLWVTHGNQFHDTFSICTIAMGSRLSLSLASATLMPLPRLSENCRLARS